MQINTSLSTVRPHIMCGVVGPAAYSPSIDFDFRNPTLDPRITFTRASTATYFDSTGTLQIASNNVARFDYNPATLAARGLLIEEQRTNSIRNNTMQGAVAGTPGTGPTNWVVPGTVNGLTQTISVGTENGISYIDFRYAGTATSTGSHQVSFEAANQSAAASGQTWTRSAWFKTQAGSTANVTVNHNLQGRDAGNTTFTEAFITDITSSLTGTLTRLSTASTLANASTAFVRSAVTFVYNNGAAIDITLRIGLPQLELGAFATSVIPTTTTALTRSADVASVNTLSPWFNATTGTLYTESVLARQNATGGLEVASIRNAGSTSFIRTFYRASGATGQSVQDTSVAQCDLTATGVISANTTVKIALAYAANDFAASGNGGAVVTDPAGTVPSGLTDMQLGGFGLLNGYLRRITYYPRKLSSAELQAITA